MTRVWDWTKLIFDFALQLDSFTHSSINWHSFLRPSNILQFGSRELSFMIMALWFVLIVHSVLNKNSIVLLRCHATIVAASHPIIVCHHEGLIKKPTLHIFILNKIILFILYYFIINVFMNLWFRYAQTGILFLTCKNTHRFTAFL